MKLIKDEARKAEIGIPEPITAEHWRRFYAERAKYHIAGPFGAEFVASYMASLTLIDQGHYEDDAGKAITLKEAGLNVPAYIMVWVARTCSEAMNDALEVPKAS